MVCMGFEPGPQDGRRRQNHGAMAAAKVFDIPTCYPRPLFLLTYPVNTHHMEECHCMTDLLFVSGLDLTKQVKLFSFTK